MRSYISALAVEFCVTFWLRMRVRLDSQGQSRTPAEVSSGPKTIPLTLNFTNKLYHK